MALPAFTTFRILALLLCLLSLAGRAQARKSWIHIQSEHFEVYSEVGKGRTRSIVEELHDAHGIFEKLFPRLGKNTPTRLKVIIARNSTLDREIAPLYDGKPKDLAGFYGRSMEGKLLVINGSVDWNFLREVVLHEYTHHLLDHPGIEFPLWMNEGLAEVFSTIERSGKGKVTVGKTSSYRLQLLAQRSLMPLDELFAVDHRSPIYNSSGHSTGIFYAQSWALIHYLLFGSNDLPENASSIVIAHAIAGKEFNDLAVQELLGIGLDTLKKELTSYCRKGRYSSYRYTLEDASRSIEFEESKLSGKELDFLIADAKLGTRGLDNATESLDTFAKAYPDAPETYTLRGYAALLSGQDAKAANLLKEAIDRGSQSAQTHLQYSGAKLRLYTQSTTFRENALDKSQTRELLTYLFKARELSGPFDEKLYQCIGEVWLSSQVRPREEHMAVLLEGLQRFPNDSQLAFYLARYYEKEKNYETAQSIHDKFYHEQLPFFLKISYQQLALRIKAARATAD